MSAVRDAIVERTPLEDHDGASGARLERVRLADGRRLILKRFDPADDLSLRVLGGEGVREIELWRAGVLDRLPPPLAHPIVDAWQEDGRWIAAMRDLSAAMLGWESSIGRAEARRILAGAAAMHARFRGERVTALASLEERLALFSTRVMTSLVSDANPLPGRIVAGWEVFVEIAPREVADLVLAIHETPAVLAGPLRRRAESTLTHSDLWLPNVALDAETVVVIDWALATHAPPMLELASFLAGCDGQIAATRDEIVADAREIYRGVLDEDALRVGWICGLVDMGWRLALRAGARPQARQALDWWVAAARGALDAGLVG